MLSSYETGRGIFSPWGQCIILLPRLRFLHCGRLSDNAAILERSQAALRRRPRCGRAHRRHTCTADLAYRAPSLMPDALIDVPHRVQLPGTACALYSLGMVMDYWHAHDSANPTALVCDKDESLQRLEPHVSRFSCAPTTPRRLLDVAIALGHTHNGSCWSASHLVELAASFGYAARAVHRASAADLKAVLSSGHPPLVIFDVDLWTGDPVLAGGGAAHVGVALGSRSSASPEPWPREPEPPHAADAAAREQAPSAVPASLHSDWVVAKHPQARSAAAYVWPTAVLAASMANVARTTKADSRPLPPALLPHLAWQPVDGEAAPGELLRGAATAVGRRCSRAAVNRRAGGGPVPPAGRHSRGGAWAGPEGVGAGDLIDWSLVIRRCSGVSRRAG